MKMPKADPSAVARFEELLPTHPDVLVKQMFGHPAAFIGGNLFMGVFGEHVFVRLSEAEFHEASTSVGARPFEPMEGRVMRGYAVLPAKVLGDPKVAKDWVARSLAYVERMPTKKSKSKGSVRSAPTAPIPRR
ncbi:MAG: TfoX/Sxy family protein [Thermoplasmata archaeon]|nr:TfoX/Sxy family protein [Thermoplasmata archaeon]